MFSDLNSIENLWSQLKADICRRYPELSNCVKNDENHEKLISAAITCWNEIDITCALRMLIVRCLLQYAYHLEVRPMPLLSFSPVPLLVHPLHLKAQFDSSSTIINTILSTLNNATLKRQSFGCHRYHLPCSLSAH